MKIDGIGTHLQNISVSASKQAVGGDFEDLVKKFVADINGDLQAASKAQEALLKGNVDNLVELMTTIEKADISLRFATELRNKAIEAYQEIMRMQV